MTTETSAASIEASAAAEHGNGYVQLVKFLTDPLGFLTRVGQSQELGAVPFKLGNLPCHLVTKPEYLKLAMHNEDWPPITRGRLLGIANWFTAGLFVNYGAEHHRQRDDLWKPLFDDPRITQLAVEHTQARVENWREGQPFEAWKELRALCFGIDWEALTGRKLQADELPLLETGVEWLPKLLLPFGPGRFRAPTPEGIKVRKSKATLDGKIAALIAERRSTGNGHDDLLGRLVKQAASDGVTTDEDIRSTFKMYFGADQLHALFVWAFYLLAKHPEIEARWHEELDRELAGRPPAPDDIPKLPYTRKVLMEAMRVYPPVFGFFRQMKGDYRLGDYTIPDGHLMGMSPWVTHRDPRVWPRALEFDPERWNEGEQRPPELSYFPFSAGPYECHGKHLAIREAMLIFPAIGQRWKLRPATGREPQPTATWATEPKGGLQLTPVRR